MRPTGRAAVVAGALLLLAGGCGDGDENTTGADEAIDLPATSAGPSPTEAAVPSGPPTVLAIVAPATGAEIKGNVVRLDVAGSGIAITPADGDISGRSGHYHVFVDRDTVAPAALIPVGAGIIHTTDDPIVIPGLTVGPHRLIVVYGDGSHRRLGYTEASTSFTVAGPSVAVSAPPNAPPGQPVTITITAEGLPVGAVFQVLVDREPPPAAQPVPDEPGVIQTAETTIAIPDLAPGAHTIWVVAGSADRKPLDPPVMDRAMVTVG